MAVSSGPLFVIMGLKNNRTKRINERVSWNDQSGEARPYRKLLLPGRAWLWPPPWMHPQMRLPRAARKHRVRALRAVHGFPQLNVRKPLSLIQKLHPDSATRGLLRGPLNYCKFRERAQQACQKSVSHRRTGPQFFARDPPWDGVHQGAPQRKRGGWVGGWVGHPEVGPWKKTAAQHRCNYRLGALHTSPPGTPTWTPEGPLITLTRPCKKKGVLLLLLLWTPWGTAINTKGYSYCYFFGPPGVRQFFF